MLVVRDGSEGSLLDTRDSVSARNDGSEDVTLHGDTKGQGADIEEEEVGSLSGLSLSGEDTGLDGGTVGNSLIGVDALLELLSVEELGKELLDLGNTGGSTNKNFNNDISRMFSALRSKNTYRSRRRRSSRC